MQKYFPWNVTSICPQMTPYSKGDTFSELWFYVKFRGCNHHWSTSDFLSRPEGCKFPMFSPRMRKYASPGWPSSFLGGLQKGYGDCTTFPKRVRVRSNNIIISTSYQKTSDRMPNPKTHNTHIPESHRDLPGCFFFHCQKVGISGATSTSGSYLLVIFATWFTEGITVSPTKTQIVHLVTTPQATHNTNLVFWPTYPLENFQKIN